MGKTSFWGAMERLAPKNNHTYLKHQVGPEKKNVFVKLPNITKMKTVIMSRKLMNMNYIYGKLSHKHFRAEKYSKIEDWNDFLNKRRTGINKYGSRILHVPRKKRKINEDLRSEDNSDIRQPGTTDAVQIKTDIVDLRVSRHESEDWQRRHFWKHMRVDLNSNEVSEVITNLRMNTMNSKDIIIRPTRKILYMETLRDAVNVHDWVRVAKCVEGLSLESQVFDKNWLIWNGGFLALINLEKDDLVPLAEFAQAARAVLKAYPRQLGIELATWFTQKGHFANGLCLLEEWHEVMGKTAWWSQPSLNKNPKRHIVDMISVFYGAVFQYLSYKRDVQYSEDELYQGDESSLIRSGEKALAMFEGVLELSEKTETDVTIFIEPLIELVATFRSDVRAKEIFEKVCGKNFRNAILDEMYIKFLKQYFPHLEDEIQEKEQKHTRFNFEINHEERIADEVRVRNYLKKTNILGGGVPFKKIENPGFSY